MVVACRVRGNSKALVCLHRGFFVFVVASLLGIVSIGHIMEYLPIKTRILRPPKDNLLAVFRESLPTLLEEDVVLISSKVVAIREGTTVPVGTDKTALIRRVADLIVPRPLTGHLHSLWLTTLSLVQPELMRVTATGTTFYFSSNIIPGQNFLRIDVLIT